MKRIAYLFLFLLAMVACSKSKTSQSTALKVDSQPVAYQEPDWGEIDIEPISDKTDEWLSVTEEQLADTLIAKLVDAYNCCVACHSLYTDLDLSWRMWWNNSSEEDLLDLQTAVKAMDCSVIRDTQMRALAEALQQSVAVAIIDTTSQEWSDALNTYINEAVGRYHVSNFGELTEEEYFHQVGYETYVKDYDKLYAKRMSNDSLHQQELLQHFAEEQDFVCRCIYAMEYVHSSDEGPYFDAAIPVLESVILAGEYAPMLYDIWRTWRAMKCLHMGMSRDSAIPNNQYNAMRRIVAQTMLRHIQTNPNDLVAINEFVSLAYCDNINRYCNFPFGNQNFEEMMIMFPDFHDRFLDNSDSEDE